ncbi:hypothetical protein COOONC_18179 [Cooperia oncophora]
MKFLKEELKEEMRKKRKRDLKKKTKKAKKKQKAFKVQQQSGIKKALEDYLAAQTQTITIEDSERVVEMPSGSRSLPAKSPAISDSAQKISENDSAPGSSPTTPVPRKLGQMPMENPQEGEGQ